MPSAGSPRTPSERAREEVAKLVNADPREIVWTSGATESDNLAIKGAANFYAEGGKHIITVKTEHKAVLDTCRELERQGFGDLPGRQGKRPDRPGRVQGRAAPDTVLVSIMMVNNEIGVIQDVETLGEICREKGIIFHVDAAQATGKVEIDLQKLKVDLMSFSAHKTYGPKGHRRAVRASQAARAHRSADARRRPRAWFPLEARWPRTRSSAWAKPSAWRARKWAPKTSAFACCAIVCGPACRRSKRST